MEICGLEGRVCIETNFAKSFNCNTTCEGIYANAFQWVGKNIEDEMEDEETEDGETEEVVGRKIKGEIGNELDKLYKQLAELKKEMKLMKSIGEERGGELDKEKYKMLIAEYRKFKTKNVKHFKFNFAENSSSFGKSTFGLF